MRHRLRDPIKESLMPVVFIQEFEIEGDDRSTTNYDAISERLDADTDPPEGLIVHTAGFDEDDAVFRILDVWETREHGERFTRERLTPIMEALLGDAEDVPPPARDGSYELHNIVLAP
jgi:hypothetical protein